MSVFLIFGDAIAVLCSLDLKDAGTGNIHVGEQNLIPYFIHTDGVNNFTYKGPKEVFQNKLTFNTSLFN